jgi:hypothetical protein
LTRSSIHVRDKLQASRVAKGINSSKLPANIMANNWIPTRTGEVPLSLESGGKNTINLKNICRIYSPVANTP